MARPLKDINWDVVEKRMEAGNSARQIAKHLRVDLDTFYCRFKREYGCGFSDFSDGIVECGEGDLQYTQHMKALSGNTQLLIWLGKVKLGQREPDMLSATPSNQDDIDKDQIIMQLQHKITELENFGDK